MARQPLPADTILGTENDQYRIDTVLGPGGFGITYLGRSLRLDRDVAIKEYFPAEFAYREGSQTIRSIAQGASSFFDQGKRYFIEEARTLGKFQHEHIVRVIGLIEQNNTAYMVLEFEEGRSLKQWLRDLGRRPTQRQIDQILDPMLSALEAIHAKGIFHRDIAPDNIIIRPSGKPVLIDFGAARQLVRGTSQTLGAIVKHGYSPPEQYTVDTRLQGAWSDIYALCATLFHAIMGQPPEEASKRQLNDTLLPIEDRLDAINRQLYRDSFIAGLNAGLALKPRDRPQTVAELRDIILDGADLSSPYSERATGDRTARERATRDRATHPTRRRTAPVAAEIDGDDAGTVLRRPSRVAAEGALNDAGDDAGSRGADGTVGIAGLAALGAGALGAIAFLGLGGGGSATGLAALTVACLGVVAAVGERLFALQRAHGPELAGAARSAAAVTTGGLAVLWLAQIGLPPIGPALPLAVLAIVFALSRYSGWMPVVLAVVALLQALVIVDAVLGNLDRGGMAFATLMLTYTVVTVAAALAAVRMWVGGGREVAEPAT